MKIIEIVKTDPIKTGTSNLFKASTISFPSPFHPKIYSTKTDPANMLANHPDKAVTTGLSEFFIAWFLITSNFDRPFA